MTSSPSLTITESGTGRPALIIHGGGGPFTVAPIAAHLAPTMRTIVPTLPGWNGTELPSGVTSPAGLATVFLDYLEQNDLRDVLVIGSSLGGWIGSELAAHDTAGRVTGLILIDAVGLRVAAAPIRDFFALDPRGVAERYYRDPATLSVEQVAVQRANMATMKSLVGDMTDPTLAERLHEVTTPTLVIWGESDRIVTPEYGRAFANAFAIARFETVAEAGHLPQLEQPNATFELIDGFIAG